METINDLFKRLEQLNDIGASLSSERNIELLLEKILVAAKQITHADGGTLYRVSEDRQRLHFAIVRTDSLGVAFGGSSAQSTSGVFPDLPLYRDDGMPNTSMVAAYSAITGLTVNIPDAYEIEGFDFSGTRKFDERTGYRSQSFLTVPMRNHESEIIGVLQLINATSPETGETVPFDNSDQRLAESLASQAAVALTNRQLIAQLEDLFESTIRMINSAIDEKSPYTGGHCQRVPELTMMLAEAVSEATEGPMAGFTLSEKDRYELRIASLLHDCGKITTPVHVVDKARKLETIYDRIHLLDTRFEVVRRDAEIRLLKALATGADRSEAAAVYADFVAEMEVDRELLRKSNIGGERMSDDDIARVRAIATKYRWQNPAGEEVPFLDDEELENLTIRAGTLTEKERQVINYHISATIKMLEQLPWPKHLRNVPEYAGGHHERMDGKGYPRGLTREQMSPQARMMGIADIFEALTATDRPYKIGMNLSQALSILENFRKNGHIDPDLHEIFVKSEVFRKYAAVFLEPGQIDC
jgi:HD-GYP domain-containing protein (c-di-GMP phosphodiesterase class II)